MIGLRYVGAGLALILFGTAGAFWYSGGRWGCPSQAELERTRAPEEVVDAFSDRGARLVQTGLPPGGWRRIEAYQGATVYRYARGRAAIFVLVCKVKCRGLPSSPRAAPIPVSGASRQKIRQISVLGNNIVVFTTDNDRRSGRYLQARVQPAMDDLDVAVPYESRCYVE